FYFLGVPLADARVGAFRTALRFGASLRYALPNGMLHAPHADDISSYVFTLFELEVQSLTN
ncbi:MAG: hypothetical protein NZ519_00545, partial [Bacteroidia bacterium]|nr:hypothetical protein [Bacteroidia bacterium]